MKYDLVLTRLLLVNKKSLQYKMKKKILKNITVTNCRKYYNQNLCIIVYSFVIT